MGASRATILRAVSWTYIISTCLPQILEDVSVAMDLSEAVSSPLNIPLASECCSQLMLPFTAPRSGKSMAVFFLALQSDFTEETSVPLPVMPYGETGSTFVVLGRPEGSLALGKFACTLRFTVKEIDPSTGVVPAPELQHPGTVVLRGMPTNGSCCMTVGTTNLNGLSGCPHTRVTTILRPPGVHCCRTGEAEEQGYEDQYQLEDLVVRFPPKSDPCCCFTVPSGRLLL